MLENVFGRHTHKSEIGCRYREPKNKGGQVGERGYMEAKEEE